MNTIERPVYLERLISRMNNGMIKIITGIRRSGKSFLLFNLFYQYLISIGISDDQIIKLALDSPENKKYLDTDELYSFLEEATKDESKKYYIMLDEVQFVITKEEIKDKDSYVRLYGILNGLLRKQNVDVYVTGSNSKLLSTDVLTEFRGRGDEVHISPLSFSEFVNSYDGSKQEAWQDYLMFGGMPYILSLHNEEDKIQYLSRLNSEIYMKDISERYELKSYSGMEEVLKVVASSIGSLVNPLRISDTFKSSGKNNLSNSTIREYLSYLQDSFLIQKVQRYDVKGRQYISTPAKYYYTDVGLRNAVLGFRQYEETHLMENVIYNELIYRGFQVDVGIVDTYFSENNIRKHKQLEIDFVANKGSRRYYLQSAFSIPDSEKMNQEQASLIKVPDSFKKIIVVGTPSPLWHNENGVEIINIIDFLLKPNSLDL